MDRFVLCSVRAALIYLLIGVSLGLAYHILPRFTGRLLHSPKLAWFHFFLANIGVVGMALFFFLNRYQEGRWQTPLAASMILQALGIVLFVYNIWISTVPLKR